MQLLTFKNRRFQRKSSHWDTELRPNVPVGIRSDHSSLNESDATPVDLEAPGAAMDPPKLSGKCMTTQQSEGGHGRRGNFNVAKGMPVKGAERNSS